ncbi:MAG: cytochrome c oxidase subunit II [Gemmatimonadales bacterium]|nr:cytochrome c oxidase subunit II [Gemmatimonadales bacterium]
MSMLRLRQAAPALLLAVCLLAITACGGTEYPNSTFNHHTDFNTSIDALWDRLLFWGTVVFVVVELALLVTIIRYRKRPGGPAAKQIHGNAALEITWTAIPAVILVLIAIPTVKTIFETQAPAPAGALKVEVIGHQWWWEFRYPELGITTANELYLPVGRTASFELKTVDVLHSFWIPQMGGKRDLITNKTNFLWFTPNADLASSAWNGFCTEYCGTSHANMRFRVFTVQPDEFASWAAHQAKPAVYPATDSVGSTGYVFPAEMLPEHTVPKTPIPAGLEFDDSLLEGGDPVAGMTNLMIGGCIGCHTIDGNPMAQSPIGPNLTHLASRHTIAGGLFPNDAPTLARWLKNAKKMKPGALMNVVGRGEYEPLIKANVDGGLDDKQIADLVAYLRLLK